MAESIVADVVERLLGYMGKSAVGEIASYFGGKDKLEQLELTMKMIQTRLIDAERSREDEARNLVKQWLKELKDVLYRLEDLFEVVAMTDDDLNNQMAAKLVCFCIPKLDRLKMNKMVNTKAEAIMRKLEGLTSNMHRLHLRVFSIEEQRAFNLINGRETDSFVLEEEVIGRDDDKNEIVRMLLAQDLAREGGVSVIPIVGMGGLGKTTLTQLAYNDINVKQHFELKHWACVSDISSFEELAGKVLKSVIDNDCQTWSIERIQSRLVEAVNNKRYLLVLDDVWDEDLDKWLRLRRSLCCGKPGSKIIVTSRSQVVASNMGTIEPYELRGLTEDESWKLFKSVAFRQGQEERNPNFSRIGREIVKKCVNVPLAIRTLAGILRSKDTEKEWELFKDTEIRKIEEKENKIMSTLKLSYDHLPSRLKQCFAYCSLFPKDYEFDRRSLIELWTSQGFIQPLHENQSPFDVGHTYFMELLRRYFFQNVQTSDYGVVRCKMHDLVHDLACMVGDECHLVDRSKDYNCDDKNIRHVYFEFMNVVDGEWIAPSSLLASQQVRSLLLSHHVRPSIANMNNILSGMRSLRALDFGTHPFDSLPKSVVELKHLRYLRIFVSSGLPNWITRLQNLQTLELLTDYVVSKWNEFPPRFGELKSLQALNRFVVGENNGLDALASMKLAGKLELYYKKSRPNEISEAMEANLKDKKLTFLFLDWFHVNDEKSITRADELLKCLQPPTTINQVRVQNWKGVGFPSWGMDDLSCMLCNLTWIQIIRCDRCRRLPTFSRLPNLKHLQLWHLHALEYIEEGEERSSEAAASSSAPPLPYFPSLEKFLLVDLLELKGWSRIHLNIGPNSLPRLRDLEIKECRKLKTMCVSPRVPRIGSVVSQEPQGMLHHLSNLQRLSLTNCEELDLLGVSDDDDDDGGMDNTSIISSAWQDLKNLCHLKLQDISELKSLPKGLSCLTTLQELEISDLDHLEALPEWIGHLIQLRQLCIEDCSKLSEFSESIGRLTALTHLTVRNCKEFKRRYEKPNGEAWPLIQHIPNAHFS